MVWNHPSTLHREGRCDHGGGTRGLQAHRVTRRLGKVMAGVSWNGGSPNSWMV